MRIDTDNPVIADQLARTAAVIGEAGGFIAADLVVTERGGDFSCAITEHMREPGRILVDYPADLRPPVHRVQWEPGADHMIPASGTEGFDVHQRELLDAWLVMVNEAAKLAQIRARVPRFCVTDWPLRHHLADAGYPAMRREPTDDDARDTLLGWHGMGEGRATDGRVRWHLIPLKNLVNHHRLGAAQSPIPGRVAVATSAISDGDGTYEDYGDLDALQLLMHFGYVEADPALVHSVPLEVAVPAVGRVVVRWRGPRDPRAGSSPPSPVISVDDDGLRLRHLAIRPGSRPHVAAALAGMIGERTAESVLDAVLQANLDYYRRLDALALGSMNTDLALVSLGQQERLRTWW